MIWDNIEKNTLKYKIAHFTVNTWLKIYYKDIVWQGIENIPKNSPVILAPNHQNALMDALAFLVPFKKEGIVFLARADIFKGKRAISFLKFCKIMPVYRIRDGLDTLQKNEEIFQQSIRVLENNSKLVVLPEGNHAGFRKLRALKKGITRIAFKAEEKNNFKLGLKIVPVGIDYSNYHKFRQTLFLNFGKPIEVANYLALFQENEQKAHRNLLATLAQGMGDAMVDIQNEAYYGLYDELRDIYKYRMQSKLGLKNLKQPNKFLCDKELIKTLDANYSQNPDEFASLNDMVKSYAKGIKKLNLKNWLFDKKKHPVLAIAAQALLLLATFPIFVYGFANSFLPFWAPYYISNKMVKDKQFTFVLGSIIVNVFYFILFVVVWIVTGAPWIKWAYLASLPFTGMFAFRYYVAAKKLFGKIRYNWYGATKNRAFIKIDDIRKNIMEMVDGMILMQKKQ